MDISSLKATPRANPVETVATFRKLTRDDTQRIQDHFLRLAPSDRKLRFLSSPRDEVINAYCARLDWPSSMLIGAFVDNVLRGIGELVQVTGWSRPSAEIALSVESAYQNVGIGSELLRRLSILARNRYIDRLSMLCLRENSKMQRIARKFNAELSHNPGEVEGQISSPWPSYMSILEEIVGDGTAFFNAVFNLDEETLR